MSRLFSILYIAALVAAWSTPIFEVRAVVDSTATLVTLGVQLTGSGTAWFDALNLDTDSTSIEVAPILPPPRPRYSEHLLCAPGKEH